MSINNLIGYYSYNIDLNICNNNHLNLSQYYLGYYNFLNSYNLLKLNSNSKISLNISKNEQLECLPKLINLKKLICMFQPYLINKDSESAFSSVNTSINSLTQLEYLDISFNENITDLGGLYRSNLTNLKTLICRECKNLTDYSINQLTQLEYLDISNCNQITDLGGLYRSNLINLKTLICHNCKNLTNEGLESAFSSENGSINSSPQLRQIDISGNEQITHLPKLTKLETLICEVCPNLSDASFNQLTNLQYLKISDNEKITDLSNLTNLRTLHCEDCPHISPYTVYQLESLGCKVLIK